MEVLVSPTPERAAQRMRPPIFGKRRDDMIAQARRLGP